MIEADGIEFQQVAQIRKPFFLAGARICPPLGHRLVERLGHLALDHDRSEDAVHGSLHLRPETASSPARTATARHSRPLALPHHRHRAVEHGDGSAPHFHVAVHVRHFRTQQAIGLHSDLVGGPVVDAQGMGPLADIDPYRPPGERLLDALR